MKKQIKLLIKRFKKQHRKFYPEGGYTDCPIVDNEMHRVTENRDAWLGDDASYNRAIKEQEANDKNTKCYICKFIKELEEML
jgi:hypothetical protein